MTPLAPFPAFFHALWGYDPFPWQSMLAERVAAGAWPSALDLPTASGKTACLEIALYALATQADLAAAERTAPRRVWFVVDRRIVVDEAFARAQQIARKLAKATSGPLKAVADRLREAAGTERPVAVARLRGGVFRDDGWARLPSQPAIITSTVDQLGSRLLFRGYGHSLLAAPIYAGLAANDSLILLDEAHCSVPFLETLRAVERFRGERWAEAPLRTPFGFVILSATPPADIPSEAVFPGIEREPALEHAVLRRRLRASKPAELVVVESKKRAAADPLIAEATERAVAYVSQAKRHVAVMVNRVRTARDIAASLQGALGDQADVVLLTGRLRPFDRDALVNQWAPFLQANRPDTPPKPIVLVSTQCLEVGADFSFDALVTEAASLDALRQRFGRLDRMGAAGTSSATILVRERDADPAKAEPDPIYGMAIANTWKLLEDHAVDDVVDFGVEPLQATVDAIGDLTRYVAPAGEAPVLLPAHLDLLCQTAPAPALEPDVQLFLHGKDRGAPEVQVVWRADLDPDLPESTWLETVGLCPPVSGEMLSIPLHQLRAFLARQDAVDEGGDVEGIAAADEEAGPKGRPFLIWRGRDRSVREDDTRRIAPGDVVVLPASYGMGHVGQPPVEEGAGAEALDLWERVLEPAGKRLAVRLTGATLARWAGCPPVAELLAAAEGREPDREEIDERIAAVLDYEPPDAEAARSAPPEWWRDLLRRARSGRAEAHPAGGVILFARAAPRRAEEADLFANDDDLASAAGAEVPHDAHADFVARTAIKTVRLCLPQEYVTVLEAAADWHNVGKLDERFQLVLHEGDELAALTAAAPLAKSASIPASPARRRAIRDAAELPEGFRHGMLSLQLAERFAPAPSDDTMAELFLHLIASHHGHARPFAPVVADPEPPAVTGSRNSIAFGLDAAERRALTPAHRLESGVADRFWRLVRRHGWWGLAYLEAILRLSDWHASAWRIVGRPEEPELVEVEMKGGLSVSASVELSGLNGANPLGFLAALGTLVTLHDAGEARARLRWHAAATWTPVITGVSVADPAGFGEIVARGLAGRDVAPEAEEQRASAAKRRMEALKALKDKANEIRKRKLARAEHRAAEDAELGPLKTEYERVRDVWLRALRAAVPRPELALGNRIDCTPEEYRQHAETMLEEPEGRNAVDLLAAFGTDACLTKAATIEPTLFQFITGAGHQFFLRTARDLMSKVSAERVRRTLFESWTYSDEKLSMRWDPLEDRRYAMSDTDPSGAAARTVSMANLLGYRALALFPAVPRRGRLRVVGWTDADGEPAFTWPLWEFFASPDTIRSLLALRELGSQPLDRVSLRERGIPVVYRARRIKVGTGANYRVNFTPARAV